MSDEKLVWYCDNCSKVPEKVMCNTYDSYCTTVEYSPTDVGLENEIKTHEPEWVDGSDSDTTITCNECYEELDEVYASEVLPNDQLNLFKE